MMLRQKDILKGQSDFNEYYGTLGVVGMNEACLNAKWLQKDLMDMHAQKFAQEVLNFFKSKDFKPSAKVKFRGNACRKCLYAFCENG